VARGVVTNRRLMALTAMFGYLFNYLS